MQLTTAARRWATLLDTFEAQSDLTLDEFAALHNVLPATLAWWRRRLRRHESPQFVSVELPRPALTSPILVRVLARDVAVEVPVGADLAWLRQVVEALC